MKRTCILQTYLEGSDWAPGMQTWRDESCDLHEALQVLYDTYTEYYRDITAAAETSAGHGCHPPHAGGKKQQNRTPWTVAYKTMYLTIPRPYLPPDSPGRKTLSSPTSPPAPALSP